MTNRQKTLYGGGSLDSPPPTGLSVMSRKVIFSSCTVDLGGALCIVRYQNYRTRCPSQVFLMQS